MIAQPWPDTAPNRKAPVDRGLVARFWRSASVPFFPQESCRCTSAFGVYLLLDEHLARHSTAAIAPRRCGRGRRRSSVRSTAHRGNGTSACPAHLDGTRLALPVARAANGPLLSGKGRAIAPQTERLKLPVISAHPAAVVGTGMPTFRGWTDNEAIAMLTAPSLERDSAAGRRTSGN